MSVCQVEDSLTKIFKAEDSTPVHPSENSLPVVPYQEHAPVKQAVSEEADHLLQLESSESLNLKKLHDADDSSKNDSKLKFGIKLEKICEVPQLNPRLMMILQHIYINGPLSCEFNLTDLSPVDLNDKHELKTKLRLGRPICPSDYTFPAIVHVLRSFLKHLPQPALHFNLYHTWISTGEIIHQHCYLPSKRDLVVHAIQQLLTEITELEETLLRHIFVSLRSLSQPTGNRYPDLGRVHEVAHLFAPCLLRRRFDWPGSNPKTEAKVALLTFVILHLHRIFGPKVKNLFSTQIECSASCCNVMPENHRSNTRSPRDRNMLQNLLETCAPFHTVGDISEVAGKEEVL